MKKLLSNAWRTLLWRGIFALLFGIMAFAWPGLTITVFIYIFAFYVLADGLSTMSGAWQHRSTDSHWGFLFFSGIISVLGLRAIFDGIVTIIAAIRLRKEIENEGWMALGGIISILFGAWVIASPGEGALAFASVIAFFAILLGIILIALALKARSWSKNIGQVKDNIKSALNR
jgi:uncharacterized membrane protein HdeD (DUF308 family)